MTDRQLRQTELPTGMVPVDVNSRHGGYGQLGGIYILATTDTGELVILDSMPFMSVSCTNRSSHERKGITVHRSCSSVYLHRTLQETAILRDLLPALAQEDLFLRIWQDTFLSGQSRLFWVNWRI